MFWSISESRSFRRCQRQWYFKNFVASATAKDALRREAYLLGKLQSISSWRGNIVDSVVSEQVVPAIRFKRTPTLNDALLRARQLFRQQLECARRHPLREPGLSPAKLGTEFAVFYTQEYGGTVSETEVHRAWEEIERALGHLFAMDELFLELRTATQIIAQRPLSFPHSGMTVRAVPDAVAFFKGMPPLIIDWKVHAFGLQEAWTQLATYAIALTRCNPHRDFPDISPWSTADVRLLEAQLLTNQLRRYSLSEDDVERADAYIADSVTRMLWATEGKKGKDLLPTDLPTAASPDTCQRCPYRKLCWEAT